MLNFKILKQPFPFDDSTKGRVILALIISISVFFILIVFQPFGLSHYSFATLLPIVLGYALLCLCVVLFNLLLLVRIFPVFFAETHWQVYKQISWIFYNILSVGLANYVYSYFLGFFTLSWVGLIETLLITFLVAVLPVVLMTFFRYNYMLNKHLIQLNTLNLQLQSYKHLPPPEPIESKNLNTAPSQITFKSEEKNGNLSIDVIQLLYIQSDDNYIEIYYLDKSNVKKSILRNTLKNVEMDLEGYPTIFRCHRSYLVNLQKVKSISGNSQGYRLEFDETDFQVPVARSFSKELKQKMENKNAIPKK